MSGRLVRRRDPIDRQLGPRGLNESRSLISRKLQHLGQPLGHFARWPACVGLDLPDGCQRIAGALGQLLLCEVERPAPPPHPVAERGAAFHRILLAQVTLCVTIVPQSGTIRSSIAGVINFGKWLGTYDPKPDYISGYLMAC